MAGTGTTLSEAASKALLREFGVPIADERDVKTAADAVLAARELGHPVVVKLNGDAIAHKTAASSGSASATTPPSRLLRPICSRRRPGPTVTCRSSSRR
jgi:acyl-CoA synthetase (NDP forming)